MAGKSKTLEGRLLTTLTIGRYNDTELAIAAKEATEYYRGIGLRNLTAVWELRSNELCLFLRKSDKTKAEL
jgi:hypothetical protein